MLRADSSNVELSNQMAGHVTLTDSMGTPRSVRALHAEPVLCLDASAACSRGGEVRRPWCRTI